MSTKGAARSEWAFFICGRFFLMRRIFVEIKIWTKGVLYDHINANAAVRRAARSKGVAGLAETTKWRK
jgi:hypothetical protein